MVWIGRSELRRAAAVLLVLGNAPVCLAEDPFLGRVLSVEPEQVIVETQENPPRQITVTPDADGIPGGLETGSIIRIWPTRDDSKLTTIRDAHLTPLRSSSRSDPTGVRSRLIRGVSRLPPPPGGPGGGHGGR